MKRFLTVQTLAVCLLALCVASASAGKYDDKTLVGTWEFDMLKMMKAAAETGDMPPGMDVEAMAKNMHMRITFNKDGTYVFESKTMGNEVTENGTWKIVKTDGDSVTVKSVNAEDEEQTVTMVFTDKDHFDAVVQEGEDSTTMSATRAKSAKKSQDKDD